MLVICVCLRLKPSAQSSESRQVQGERFSVSADASSPKQQDFQNESPTTGKRTRLLFDLLTVTRLFSTSRLFSSPPRPSPGSLHYSDEDVSAKYNDLIPAESSSLTEKPSEISDSQVSQRRKKNKLPAFGS